MDNDIYVSVHISVIARYLNNCAKIRTNVFAIILYESTDIAGFYCVVSFYLNQTLALKCYVYLNHILKGLNYQRKILGVCEIISNIFLVFKKFVVQIIKWCSIPITNIYGEVWGYKLIVFSTQSKFTHKNKDVVTRMDNETLLCKAISLSFLSVVYHLFYQGK